LGTGRERRRRRRRGGIGRGRGGCRSAGTAAEALWRADLHNLARHDGCKCLQLAVEALGRPAAGEGAVAKGNEPGARRPLAA